MGDKFCYVDIQACVHYALKLTGTMEINFIRWLLTYGWPSCGFKVMLIDKKHSNFPRYQELPLSPKSFNFLYHKYIN